MALFVMIADECKKEASKNLIEAMETFKHKVEDSQDIRLFDQFPSPYLVKKMLGGRQYRLIATKQEAVFNDINHTVIVFLSVMTRGERSYEDFSKQAKEYGDRHFKSRFKTDELLRCVQEGMQNNEVKEKKKITDEEMLYLYDAPLTLNNEGEEITCESEDWLNLISLDVYKDRLISFWEVLSEWNPNEKLDFEILKLPKKQDLGILVKYFPKLKIRYFIAPVNTTQTEEIEKLKTKYGVLTGSVNSEPVLMMSKRSYPSYVIASDDTWTKLEKGIDINLALSTEETGILETALDPKGSFPLFINGRAGSGKSTILQYLFTEYLDYHMRNRIDEVPPVYFTCSSGLLRKARSIVENLVDCGWKILARSDRKFNVPEGKKKKILTQAFREFHEYLRTLIPSVDEKYVTENYISYNTFRKKWLKKYERRNEVLKNYGPELCWHVIRTYIKGTSAESYLEPEEYIQLDQKQRSVTPDTYDWIYKNVWENWYQPLGKEGYWDDQDITRYVIENELLHPIFPGVFCDEAQDFTRIELDAILRVSLFSDRNVMPAQIPKIPFVFAGDPFQTLNPTGFRWDSVKAWFAEKFIYTMDPTGHSGLTDLNYRDLNNNYRSTKEIVKFCNFVQALRGRIFQISGMVPQTTWDNSDSISVVSYKVEDAMFWESIGKKKEAIFIVPCAEGGEVDYIGNDPVLREHIPIKDGVPTMTVLSPSGSKGLEFPLVIVYGFGEEMNEYSIEKLITEEVPWSNTDKSLPYEYFINKLYVAVSRARKQLIIVDSEKGLKKLWVFAQDPELEKKIVENLKGGSALWSSQLFRLQDGRPEHLDLSETGTYNLRKNAEELEKKGMDYQDVYLLKQAGVIYQNAHDESRSVVCRAYAHKYDEQYETAGDLFVKAKKPKEAIDCYFRIGKTGWNKIIALNKEFTDVVDRIEYMMSDYLVNTKKPEFGIRALKAMITKLESDGKNDVFRTKAVWQGALDKIAIKILGTENDLWVEVDICARGLDAAGLPVKENLMAQIAFKAGDFKRARTLWEQLKETNTREYIKAKAEDEPYPKNLIIFADSRLEDWTRIDKEFRKNNEVAFDEKEYIVIVDAYIKLKNIARVFEIAIKSKNLKVLDHAMGRAKSNRIEGLYESCEHQYIILCVWEKEWKSLKDIIDNEKCANAQCAVTVARSIARMENMGDISLEGKTGKVTLVELSDYLKKHLLSSSFTVGADVAIEVGAGIEKAGRFNDGLSYYEKIIAGKYSRYIKNVAGERWIKCKERLAKYFSEKHDENRAKEMLQEASDRRNVLGLSADVKIAESVVLGTYEELYESYMNRMVAKPSATIVKPAEKKLEIKTQEDDKDRKTVEYENYRFEFYGASRRLNIEDTETGELIIVKNNTVSSNDLSFSEIDGVFKSDKCAFTVRWGEEEGRQKIVIHFVTNDKDFVFP